MKLNKTLTALAVSASFGLSGQAFAAGTEAGTIITNTASMTYTVGSTPITETDDAKLTVDTKVDLTFTWDNGPKQNVAAGSTSSLKFALTNTGNFEQNFKFTTFESTDGTVLSSFTAPNNTDNENTAGSITFYLDDDGASVGSLDTANDTQLTNDIISGSQLALDTTTTIWALITIKDDSLDTSRIGLQVRAQAVDSSGDVLVEDTTTDKSASQANLDKNLIVFADDPSVDNTLSLSGGSNRDGGYVVLTQVDVEAASLEVTKTVSVISDVLGSSNPRAIPGSVVEYIINVENTGAVAANAVDFLDDLTFDVDSDGNNDIDRTSISIISVDTDAMVDKDFTPTISSAQTAATNNTPTPGPDFGKVKFNFDSIGAGETLIVTFRATIE